MCGGGGSMGLSLLLYRGLSNSDHPKPANNKGLGPVMFRFIWRSPY